MEDVVVSAGAGPKPNRTVIAAALVVVLLGALVFAFYSLDGASVVRGVLTSLGVADSGTPSGQPGGVTPAPPVAKAPDSQAYPNGVDAAFAQRVYAEQLDSQANIARLVGGDVASFKFGRPLSTEQGVDVPITVAFKDGTRAPGVLGLEQRGSNWFFSYIAGRREAASGGFADGVSMNGDDAVRELDADTVDQGVVKTVLAEQVKSQDVLGGIADGSIAGLSVGAPKRSVGTVTLPVSLTRGDGTSTTGNVVCIKKLAEGKDTWFVSSFGK